MSFESNVGILCCCLPMLRPLLMHSSQRLEKWKFMCPFHEKKSQVDSLETQRRAVVFDRQVEGQKQGFFSRMWGAPRLPTRKASRPQGFYTDVMASISRVEEENAAWSSRASDTSSETLREKDMG